MQTFLIIKTINLNASDGLYDRNEQAFALLSPRIDKKIQTSVSNIVTHGHSHSNAQSAEETSIAPVAW